MLPNEVGRSFVEADAQSVSYEGGAAEERTRSVAVEVPVNIVYGPTPFAVMMATPENLEDFAVGFSLTEGIIESANDIRSIEFETVALGLRLVVTLSAQRMQQHLARSRNMAGRTGCGLCGIDDLSALPVARTIASAEVAIAAAAIERALAMIEERQPLNEATRAVHAAAWCGCDGAVELVREDVGRHNALDKLIGALVRSGRDGSNGFLLITSRCSFEMIEKAAVMRARIVVAMSAPTSLAIERAKLHDMTLVAIARRDGATIFTGGHRIRRAGESA